MTDSIIYHIPPSVYLLIIAAILFLVTLPIAFFWAFGSFCKIIVGKKKVTGLIFPTILLSALLATPFVVLPTLIDTELNRIMPNQQQYLPSISNEAKRREKKNTDKIIINFYKRIT